MTTKTTTLSIRISSEMRLELEALAEKNRLSLSDFVKRTLRENMTGRRFEQAQNDLTRWSHQHGTSTGRQPNWPENTGSYWRRPRTGVKKCWRSSLPYNGRLEI